MNSFKDFIKDKFTNLDDDDIEFAEKVFEIAREETAKEIIKIINDYKLHRMVTINEKQPKCGGAFECKGYMIHCLSCYKNPMFYDGCSHATKAEELLFKHKKNESKKNELT